MDNKDLLQKVIKVVELFELFNAKSFEGTYNGLSINEVHTIAFIGEMLQPKLTDIANFLTITRGGATKITKRLINEGYIQSYKLEANKKEKYFRLTISGYAIFNKHQLIHEENIKRDAKMFSVLNDEEKRVAIKFLSILENDLVHKLQQEGTQCQK